MASRYFAALKGDRLKAFTECMKQEGKFCHYHVKIANDKILLNFQNCGFLEVIDKHPKVYVVSQQTVESFKEKYPDVQVQYIKNEL